MNSDDELLRRYVKAASIPLVNTDAEKYPVRAGRVTHLFSREYVLEFVEDLNELKKMGLTHKDIGKLFRNPTRISRMSHHIIKGAKQAGFSLEEQRRLALELIDIIRGMKSGNTFNEDEKNILLTDTEIEELLKEKNFLKADAESARIIQTLCGVMWAYSETPYFVAHDISMEEHGMYEKPIGNIVIRDYYNLRPVELWPECGEFPYNTMRIICIYDKRFKVGFDFYGNIYHKEGNPVSSLLYYYIEADRKPVDISVADSIIDASSRIIESIIKKVESMGEKGIAKKYADMFWYRKRPMRDALNKPWAPSEQIYELINKGEVKPEKKGKTTEEDVRKDIGLI